MNITNEKLLNIITKKKPQSSSLPNNYIGIILNSYNISSFTLKKDPLFQNIEFLSLQNNLLRDINFIKGLHNLYYLDLYKNSIEDFEPLNRKNIFGFLHISVEHFNEKKILQVKRLSVGIMRLDIEEKSYIKLFLNNNPNIIVLNNEVIYLTEFLGLKEAKRATKLSRTIVELKENEESKKKESKHNLIDVSEKNMQNVNIKKLVEYFVNYAKDITTLLGKENTNTLRKMKISPLYINLERKKLITLSHIYHNIINYMHQIKNENCFYSNTFNNILISSFDFNLFKNGSVQSSIIILISLLLYIINITTKAFTINVLNYVLARYFHFKKEKMIPDDILKFHLIAIYYNLYDSFYKEYNDKITQIQRKKIKMDLKQEKKYDEIIQALRMDNLILKSNFLFNMMDKGNQEIKMFNNKKNIIKEKIEILDQLDIKKEIIIFVQFLSDFLIHDKVDNELILNANYKADYAFFIEFKENLFQQSDIPSTLSDKKFQQNQIENLNNVFYFKRENIENSKIINENSTGGGDIFSFLSTPPKNRMITINPQIGSRSSFKPVRSKYLYEKLKTESYNFEDDYKVEDEIEVGDCLKVNKVYTTSNHQHHQTDINKNNKTEDNEKALMLPIIATKKVKKDFMFFHPKKRVYHINMKNRNEHIKNSQSVTYGKTKKRNMNSLILSEKRRNFKTINQSNTDLSIKNSFRFFSKGKIYNNNNTKIKIRKENEEEDKDYMTTRQLFSLFSIQSYDERELREKRDNELRKQKQKAIQNRK